jgi:hypothetical protein
MKVMSNSIIARRFRFALLCLRKAPHLAVNKIVPPFISIRLLLLREGRGLRRCVPLRGTASPPPAVSGHNSNNIADLNNMRGKTP